MASPRALLRPLRSLAGNSNGSLVAVHGFLAPALLASYRPGLPPSSRRTLSTNRPSLTASREPTLSPPPPPPPTASSSSFSTSSSSPPSSSPSPSPSPSPPSEKAPPGPRRRRKPLTPAQRALLSRALRVNHAGELAAVLIYRAQTPPVVRREPHLRPLMRHMLAQEEGHLAHFEAALARHRVRPTALYPAWSAAATALGWAMGAMGREAAMACTEAVETEIGDHYNAQIRAVLDMTRAWEREGYEVGPEFRDMLADLRRIRDEELEHLDHAVEHDARDATPHWLLTGVIRAGCRGAIWLSERV